MYFTALATDYDETIADEGVIGEPTRSALEALRRSGRRLLLVTGRRWDDLVTVCPHTRLFDLVVAENGAVVVDPAARVVTHLAAAAPASLVAMLREQGVPVAVGHSIVATVQPHEPAAARALQQLGLDHVVIRNKGAVMILPPGVDKASGVRAALARLGIETRHVVAVGDAENDQAFLSSCGFGVAVANALPALKLGADWVTSRAGGAGVAELIEALIATDLEKQRAARR